MREIEKNIRRAERRGGDAFRGVSGRPYRAANGALRAVLASRPDVALVAATHAVARRVCYETPSYEAGSVLSLSSEDGGCALACKRRRDKQGCSAVVRDPFRMGAGDTRRIERLCGTGCLYRNKAF